MEKNLGRVEASRYERRVSSPTTECLDVPDNTYRDGAHVLRAIDVMADLAKSDKPFFFAVGINKPHLPFAAPKKYWDLFDRDAMPLAKFRDNARDAPRIAFQNGGEIRNYADVAAVGEISRDFGGLKLPEDKQRELIHGYYAATSYADALVGKLLSKLDELGLANNTVVVIAGDHGWHLGDNNMWCKHSNFEQAVRTPLIISAPGIPNSKNEAPVEFIDITPTLADLAGLKPLKELDGLSLVPVMKNPEEKVKDFAISQYPRGKDGKQVMGYSLRTRNHRYTIWMDKDWISTMPYKEEFQIGIELYDYKKDPLETRNLAEDPDYANVAKSLRDQMLTFFQSQTH
jgi:arylsulfatase A-like enzyme